MLDKFIKLIIDYGTEKYLKSSALDFLLLIQET